MQDNIVETTLTETRVAQQLIYEYVIQDSFTKVLSELWSLPENLRHEFVEIAIMDSEFLRSRGVHAVERVKVSRSYFADERPTLFCVYVELPDGMLWRKVTITYDNERVALKRPEFALDKNGDLLPVLREWQTRNISRVAPP